MNFGRDWIVAPSREGDGWLVWKAPDGERVDLVRWAGASRERAPAVVGEWLGLSDSLATPRTVRIGSATAAEASYQGPLSSGDSETRFVAGADSLIAVIEGKTLARVDPSTGKALWSCRGGPVPPGQAQPVVCVDENRVYWLSAGIARCFSLEKGALLWERHVGPAVDAWRIERAGPWLALVPIVVNSQSRLTLCDPDCGAIVARIACPGRSGGVRLATEPERFVLATDTRLAGYQTLCDSND